MQVKRETRLPKMKKESSFYRSNDRFLYVRSTFLFQCNEIRKINSNQIVIGKTMVDNDKEDFNNDANDDDYADNAEESEGNDDRA